MGKYVERLHKMEKDERDGQGKDGQKEQLMILREKEEECFILWDETRKKEKEKVIVE